MAFHLFALFRIPHLSTITVPDSTMCSMSDGRCLHGAATWSPTPPVLVRLLVLAVAVLSVGCFPETDLDRVEAGFARYQELWSASDPAVGVLYAADARIVTRVDGAPDGEELVVTGEELQAGFTDRMRDMREARDRNQYEDVKIRHVGAKFRIYGKRVDGRGSYQAPFLVEYMKSTGGSWFIVVDHMTVHDKP